jgi:uncharacterized membrane protein YhaH (DUF805 family)
MNWYLAVLKNYVGFEGRARRTEYWMFTLVNTLILVALLILGLVSRPLLSLYGLYGLAVLLPSFAVSFRRLHDIDKSAWWLLISLIPIVGPIVFLVFACLPGTPGPNRYGADPKAAAAV